MSPEMRLAKLSKLLEIEGFEDENDLFAAAVTDSVCPAICCNPDGLQGPVREEFLDLSMRDLLGGRPDIFLDRSWVRGLSVEKNFELAAGTMILAHKPM